MENASCPSEYKDGVLTLRIAGEIDHHGAKSLREKLDEAIYLYRAPTVVLDLAGVAFMDSSGLGLIMGRYARARELGGRLKVVDPEPDVRRLLTLCSVGALVEIDGKEDAV